MRTLAVIIAAAVVAGSLGCAAPEMCAHVGQPVTFDTTKPLTLRIDAGSVWASPNAVSDVSRTWRVPARGPVEDLAVDELPHHDGYGVSFRQGGAIWRGGSTPPAARVAPCR